MKFIPSQLFYVFLALIGATAVPLMAHAEDGDGPSVTVVHHSGDTEKLDPKKPDAVTPDDTKAATPAPIPDTYGIVGGSVGGSSQQGFAVGAHVGYSGDHEGASVGATLGAGGPSIFSGTLSVQGMRTNGNSMGGVTVAGVLNGGATIGTSGDGTANGVGAAAIIVPFSGSGIGCMLGVGPAAGAAYSTEMAGKDASGANRTTAAAGPGGYLGLGCEGSFWKVDLYNHAIVNSLHWNDPTNPTVAVLETRLQASFRVNQNMAVGAWAQLDSDVRDTKYAPTIAGGGMLSFSFGDSKKPAPKAVSKVEAE